MCYIVYIFDNFSALATLLFDCVNTYAMVRFIRSSSMTWIVTAYLMSHLLLMRLLSMLDGNSDPWAVDVSIAQMVLLKKLTTFAWNVHDGRQDPIKLSEAQKKKAIALPHLLEYLGYALFFPTMFAGPSFEYVEYSTFIDHSMFDKSLSSAQDFNSQRVRAAVKKLISGCIWLSLSLCKFQTFTLENLLGWDFARRLFWEKLVILHLFAVIVRFRYYAIWELVNGACILSGFGYSGLEPGTNKSTWNRLQNVRPLQVEFAQNAHAYLGNWNIHTHLWLKNYIYLRICKPGEKPGEKPGFNAAMTTFVFSALWHGLYPGYFITFIMGGLLSTVASGKAYTPAPSCSTNFVNILIAGARRYVRPLVLELRTKFFLVKSIYDFLSLVSTQLAFDFAVLPFIVLSLNSTLAIWAQLYFYVLWSIPLGLGVIALLIPAGPAVHRTVETLLSVHMGMSPRMISAIWRHDLKI